MPNENDNSNGVNSLATEAELANQLASRSVDLPDEISSSFMQYALSIILGRVSSFFYPTPPTNPSLFFIHARMALVVYFFFKWIVSCT